MLGKRRQYTQEFKDSAVKLVTEQGYKISEAARNLGIDEKILSRWKRMAEGIGGYKPESVDWKEMQAELVRLKKENQRLKLEREILKKAAAFFAKESGSGIK